MPSERELYLEIMRNHRGVVCRAHSRPPTPEEEDKEIAKLVELLEQYSGDWDCVITEFNAWCDEQGIP